LSETLKFFRALWRYQLAEILSKWVACILLDEAIKEFKEVIAIAPTWREPSEGLKRLRMRMISCVLHILSY